MMLKLGLVTLVAGAAIAQDFPGTCRGRCNLKGVEKAANNNMYGPIYNYGPAVPVPYAPGFGGAGAYPGYYGGAVGPAMYGLIPIYGRQYVGSIYGGGMYGGGMYIGSIYGGGGMHGGMYGGNGGYPGAYGGYPAPGYRPPQVQACSCDKGCFSRGACCDDVSDVCGIYSRHPTASPTTPPPVLECPRGDAGGTASSVVYSPDTKILSVAETQAIPGWADATAGLDALPSIPYVPNAAFAAGHDDIVLSNVQIGTRANQLLVDHAFPYTFVSMYGQTLPAAAFFQTALPLTDVRQFRAFLANAEETALIEQEESLEDNARRFTDADFATDVWFQRTIAKGVIAYNPTFMLQKVSWIHITMLADEMGGQFQPLPHHFWLDLRFMDDQKPLNRAEVSPEAFAYSTNTQYGVGSVVIMEMDGDKVLRPVAIRVAMTKADGGKAQQVFVRGECTDSAWIMALLAAACSYTQTGVGISHIYGYHIQAANFQQQFFNNLGPDHTLYEMLSPMTKFTMQFDSAVLANSWAPLGLMPYYAHDMEQFGSVLKGWNTLAEKFPYFKLLPSITLREQGIRQADFTRDEAWDLFPLVKFQLSVEQAARKFVSAYVDHLYVNNEDVRSDAQLRSFFEAMQDPSRGNVRPTAGGRLSTVQDVKEFLIPYVYGTLVHGSARMPRYILAGTVVPNDIASFMSTELVDMGPNAEYTMQSILTSLPDTSTLFEQYKFTTFFQSTDNFGSLVPPVASNTEMPYSCADFNAIFVDLQEDVRDIYNEGYYMGFDDTTDIDTISRWPINQEAR